MISKTMVMDMNNRFVDVDRFIDEEWDGSSQTTDEDDQNAPCASTSGVCSAGGKEKRRESIFAQAELLQKVVVASASKTTNAIAIAEGERQCSSSSSASDTAEASGGHARDNCCPEGGCTGAAATSKKERLWLKIRMRFKKLALFWPLTLAQLLCVTYIVILTFSEAPIGLVDPKSGNIVDVTSPENTANGFLYVNGDYRPVVAAGTWQMCCLALSRMSAFSLYPMLIIIFLTKCKACHSIFVKTPLSMFLVLHDAHELHNYAGHFIAADVWIHTLFHILRWVDQGNVSLLWSHRTGLSGLIVVLSVPLITLPMIFWKEYIPYEIRKGLHYLFFVFGAGLCFHVPMSAVPNGGFIAPVMGFCMCLYVLDATYVYLFMTEKIETTTFHVLSSGVRITMPVSDAFHKRSEKGGFAFVCLPWVDQKQWHAFSLFEDPSDPSRRQMFMMKTGDWTTAVHKALQRNTVRPVWLQGPFPSPYNQAEMYDNQILVATGIGITPALSVIRAHKSSRRINLIWAVRDPAMLEFFLEHMYLDHDGWNLIFYTGKEPLLPALEELNTNVRVIKGRPDLKSVIPNIIYGIESSVGLPETCTPSSIARIKELLIEKMQHLDTADLGRPPLSSKAKVAELTAFANAHGFIFTEIINDMKKENAAASRRRSSRYYEGTTWEEPIGDDMEGLHRHSARPDEANIGASVVLRQVREYVKSYSCPNTPRDIDDEQEDQDHQSACRSLIDSAVPISGNRREAMLSHAASSSFARSTRTQSFGAAPDRQHSFSTNSYDGGGTNAIGSPGDPTGGTMRYMWKSIRQSITPLTSDEDVTKALASTCFKPWEKTDNKAEYYVRGLDREHILPTWGILYCGGSPPVQNALKEISTDYRIALSIDSFSW